jgi:Tol biopolymer transport system component
MSSFRAAAASSLVALMAATMSGSFAVAADEHQWGSVTERISMTADGAQARGQAVPWPAISCDGRFVVFVFAGRLVAQDTNGQPDVYVRDRETDSVELISRAVDGGPADMGSKQEVDISDDGRFVVFASRATNIVVGDNNGRRDVFLYDRLRATTRLVSHAKGRSANGTSYEPVISGDGRTVAFTSGAANLVAGDTNRRRDIFVWNRADSSISRVSVDSAGRQMYQWSRRAVLSTHGRFVSFASPARRLVANDTNGQPDVFIHDLRTGTTRRISVSSGEQQAEDGPSWDAAISGNGRFVAFGSHASNLLHGDDNTFSGVFVRDRWRGTTRVVSVDSAGNVSDSGGSYSPDISADGRFIVFESSAQLTPDPPYILDDVFIHDRVTRSTRLVSVPVSPNDDPCLGCSGGGASAKISADGRHITWWSHSDRLVEGEGDSVAYDVFARD